MNVRTEHAQHQQPRGSLIAEVKEELRGRGNPDPTIGHVVEHLIDEGHIRPEPWSVVAKRAQNEATGRADVSVHGSERVLKYLQRS